MKWRCLVCGYIHEGDSPPPECPVCGVGPEEFEPLEEESGAPAEREQTPRRVVIAGNGAAGMEAARTLRELDPRVEIHLFSAEPYHFYSRIHLSPFLADEYRLEELFIYPEEWYREHRLEVHLADPIEGIDPEKREVRDAKGAVYPYDRLILTTGARPFCPPIPGVELPGVFTLRSIHDALQIKDFSRNVRAAVVVGGGILGIEAASSLQKRGLEVTVVEMADQLMPLQLDRQGAGVLQRLLEQRGIRFLTASKIARITGDGQVSRVVVEAVEAGVAEKQQEIQAGMVLISAGISPNLELAREAGLTVKRGIVVDEYLETSRPGIYAAGDVAEFAGRVYGIWPAAVEQGAAAAKNALGVTAVYQGTLPLNILKVAGVDMTTLGKKYADLPREKEIIHLSQAEGKYVKLIHDGEKLRGAIVLGETGLGFRLEKIMKRDLSIKDLLPELEKGNWSVLKKRR